MTEPKKTRRVRTDSGAVFAVDPSMLEGGESDAKTDDYRASHAPPNVSEIVPAPPRARPRIGPALIALVAVVVGIVVALALLRS